jgi:hypothetical protein
MAGENVPLPETVPGPAVFPKGVAWFTLAIT